MKRHRPLSRHDMTYLDPHHTMIPLFHHSDSTKRFTFDDYSNCYSSYQSESFNDLLCLFPYELRRIPPILCCYCSLKEALFESPALERRIHIDIDILGGSYHYFWEALFSVRERKGWGTNLGREFLGPRRGLANCPYLACCKEQAISSS